MYVDCRRTVWSDLLDFYASQLAYAWNMNERRCAESEKTSFVSLACTDNHNTTHHEFHSSSEDQKKKKKEYLIGFCHTNTMNLLIAQCRTSRIVIIIIPTWNVNYCV